MRRIIFALAVGLCAGLLQTHQVGRAQTGATPAPSATGTPAPESTPVPTGTAVAYPDPAALLQQAKAAVKAAKTFHFHERYTIEIIGVLADLKAAGDMDLSKPAAKSHVTGKLSAPGEKAQNVTEDEVFIKKQAWVKSSKTHNVWKAAKVSDVIAPAAGNPTNLLAGSKGSRVTNLTNVGPDTVQGVAVWHLHASAVVPVTSSRSVTGPLDYYVGQSDGLLYAASIQVDDTTDGIALGIAVSYSKFAQPVTIKTPKVGSP